MMRLVVYLIVIALVAAGLGWLADRPGTLHMVWQGYDIETSVFRAAVILSAGLATAVFLWSVLRTIWQTPAAIGERILRRRQKRGLESLSSGMIAVGAGDKMLATRYALQARKALPHEPMTHLLRAQAAQLSGDRATARRIFESMLAAPDTEQLGLRGLFLEAEREGAEEAAKQFAERAFKSNTKLGWASDSLFEIQCRQRNWTAALETLALAKWNGLVEKPLADRRRAVLLTGQAQEAEEADPDKALSLALEAHGLAPDLVPAAAIAARVFAGKGQTGKAAKIVQKTWARAPHPDLATVYAYARIGDSPRDRLDRVRQLAALNLHSIESPIAVATTAIDARFFSEAREALAPLLDSRLTQRVATLMARIEAGENDDKGRVREWLARAANAARDPAWTADGVISDHWEPVSPVTGMLDAFQWRVPVETLDPAKAKVLGDRLEELLAISAPAAPLTAAARTTPAAKGDDVVDAEAVTVRPEPTSASLEPASTTAAPFAGAPAKPEQMPSQTSTQKTDKRAAPTTSTAKTAAPAQTRGEDRKPAPAPPPAQAAQPGGKASDAHIFVAPRAPDDPGPDEGEGSDEGTFPKRTFRAAN